MEKSHRAGTGKDFTRIYPWKRGKESPRGYRERIPADIPVEARRRATARVQEKISRGYTRGSVEKSHRAGTGKDFPRIYPWKRGKEPLRGYRGRFRVDIPATARKRGTARVQGKISRGYTRESGEKSYRAGTGKDFARIYPRKRGKESPRGYRGRFPADIPAEAQKRVTARVQGKISRGYTRDRAEKHCRAGTGKDFPRIYPRKRGKESPRGYRRGFPADIPTEARKRVAARVQEKISREYTRGSAEKSCRAGTGEEIPRIYPRPHGKESPRGYRRRFPADIPMNMISLLPRELY